MGISHPFNLNPRMAPEHDMLHLDKTYKPKKLNYFSRNFQSLEEVCLVSVSIAIDLIIQLIVSDILGF